MWLFAMFLMSVMFGKAKTNAMAAAPAVLAMLAMLAVIPAVLPVLLFSSCGAEARGGCAPFAPAAFEEAGESFPYGYFSFV
jgi:hypothetical protein